MVDEVHGRGNGAKCYQSSFYDLLEQLATEHERVSKELSHIRAQMKRRVSFDTDETLVEGTWVPPPAPSTAGHHDLKSFGITKPRVDFTVPEHHPVEEDEHYPPFEQQADAHDEAIGIFIDEFEDQQTKDKQSAEWGRDDGYHIDTDIEARRRSSRTDDTSETMQEERQSVYLLHTAWDVEQASQQHAMMTNIQDTKWRHKRSSHQSPWFTQTNSSLAQGRKLILYPTGPVRMVWDIMSVMLLGWDIITVPILAFNPEPNVVFDLMDWTTLVFWTLDMPLTLITSYFEKGKLVTNHWKIFLHYVRTWLVVDVMIVVPDWTFSLIGLSQGNKGDGDTKYSRLLRTTRVVRILRLLRLAKLQRFFNILKDMIETEAVFLSFSVVQLLAVLLVVNHLVGSLWYLIGDIAKGADGRSWITRNAFYEEPLMYRYTTSLHWALTQFTPGSMSVQPENVAERIYSIMILVFGLIMFSSVTASITAAMTQLRNLRGQTAREFWLLRRYLRQQQTPTFLSTRILRYAEYAHKGGKAMVPESRVTLLAVLSDQLRNELSYVVSFPRLLAHPLFKMTTEYCTLAMYAQRYVRFMNEHIETLTDISRAEDMVGVCSDLLEDELLASSKHLTKSPPSRQRTSERTRLSDVKWNGPGTKTKIIKGLTRRFVGPN